jgi:hypothetical protein
LALALRFPELGDVTMRKTWRQRPTAAGTADGCIFCRRSLI